MTSEASYEIRPISYPDDVEALLEVGYQAFASDPTAIAAKAMLTSDESQAIFRSWRRARLANAIEGRTPRGTDTYWAKAVCISNDGSTESEKVVAMIGFHGPAVDPDKPRLEPHPMVPALESLPAETQNVIDYYQKMDDVVVKRSAELIGPEPDAHYWYLASLGTMPDHQQRGLANKLVAWGLDMAKADAKARPGKIKGVWTVATPMGLKTYLKAGMKEVGSEIIDYGKGGGENGQKYVWLLKTFDQ